MNAAIVHCASWPCLYKLLFATKKVQNMPIRLALRFTEITLALNCNGKLVIIKFYLQGGIQYRVIYLIV